MRFITKMLVPSCQPNWTKEEKEAEIVEQNSVTALIIIEVGIILLVLVEFAFLLERCA